MWFKLSCHGKEYFPLDSLYAWTTLLPALQGEARATPQGGIPWVGKWGPADESCLEIITKKKTLIQLSVSFLHGELLDP